MYKVLITLIILLSMTGCERVNGYTPACANFIFDDKANTVEGVNIRRLTNCEQQFDSPNTLQ